MSTPSNENCDDNVQKNYAFFLAWLAKINDKSTDIDFRSSIMDRTKYDTIIAALIREENGEEAKTLKAEGIPMYRWRDTYSVLQIQGKNRLFYKNSTDTSLENSQEVLPKDV